MFQIYMSKKKFSKFEGERYVPKVMKIFYINVASEMFLHSNELSTTGEHYNFGKKSNLLCRAIRLRLNTFKTNVISIKRGLFKKGHGLVINVSCF